MNKEDEQELFRLTELLQRIDGKLDPAAPEREGLKKSRISSILIFFRGL